MAELLREGPWWSFCPVCGVHVNQYDIWRPTEDLFLKPFGPPTRITITPGPIFTAAKCKHHWEGIAQMNQHDLTITWDKIKPMDQEMFDYLKRVYK